MVASLGLWCRGLYALARPMGNRCRGTRRNKKKEHRRNNIMIVCLALSRSETLR